MRLVYRSLVWGSTVLALAAAATDVRAAKTITLKGQVGYIGEWAFAATMDMVTLSSDAGTPSSLPDTRYAGPLKMRHIGACSANGPDEHTGRMTATIRSDTVEKLTLSYESENCVYTSATTLRKITRGFMRCNGTASVPIYFWMTP